MARHIALTMSVAFLLVAPGCIDTQKLAVTTTSKILVKAQPSLKQETDYDMAARAIPGALKTVEGFHLASPDNERLTAILADGYCQYATGFVEDEMEVALIAKDFDLADHHARRGTKMFLRCMGYGLELLGDEWAKPILAGKITTREQLLTIKPSQRNALLWTANGLAGAINFSKDDPDMLGRLTTARVMLERVVELDELKPPKDSALAVVPLIALGMLHSSIPEALGGQPEVGAKYFEAAVKVTSGKFLLAKVFFARRYSVAKQNRKQFVDTLIEVLQTDPAIWPDQRLANEIAHRRARRYLKQEKEYF